jgi:hypothetical protein
MPRAEPETIDPIGNFFSAPHAPPLKRGDSSR